MRNWKLNVDQRNYQPAPTNGTIVKPNELRLSMEAKKTQAAELKQRYCAEGPLSDTWSDQKAKNDYFKLRREIKDLNARIASYS